MTDQNRMLLDTNPEVVRLPHTGAHTILKDRLYLSPAASAFDEELLQLDGISHVLNTAIDVDTQQFHPKSGIRVLHLKLYDSPDQKLPFGQAASLKQVNGGGRCLVHCNAGQSRSASMIIYFLMTKGYSLKESFDYVKRRKPNIRPNFGFVSQLQEAEKQQHALQHNHYDQEVPTLDMNEYKAESLLEILEGSSKTRQDVMDALQKTQGNVELALGLLLE